MVVDVDAFKERFDTLEARRRERRGVQLEEFLPEKLQLGVRLEVSQTDTAPLKAGLSNET